MFVLRAIFWLTVLAFLLPAGGEITRHMQERQAHAEPPGTHFAARPASASAEPAALAGPYRDERAHRAEAADPAESIDKLGQAIRLAQATALAVRDLMHFCERNPDVCDTAADTASFVTAQLTHYGGRAIELADRAIRDEDAPPAAAAPRVIWEKVSPEDGPVPMERPHRF